MGTQHLLSNGQKIFVCALCCSNLFFGFSISLISKTEQIFTLHFFVWKFFPFCNFCWKKPRASLLKNILLLLVYVLFSHFSLTVVRSVVANDTDIGRGSSVAASGLIPFLVSSSFLAFIDFSSFFTTVFFFVLLLLRSLFLFCNSCFFLPLFCFICLLFSYCFLPSFLKTPLVLALLLLISSCFSVIF